MVLKDLLANEDIDGFGLISVPPASLPDSLSLLSPPKELIELLPKSSDVPGVLGVLAEDPNDANAPEPRPKAEDAPFVGEATFVVVKGEMPLNGLGFPLAELSPPNRLVDEYVRVVSVLLISLPLLLGLDVETASLLELSQLLLAMKIYGDYHATYFERRCQRLSIYAN